MEEALENNKESMHSAHANEMNECDNIKCYKKSQGMHLENILRSEACTVT